MQFVVGASSITLFTSSIDQQENYESFEAENASQSNFVVSGPVVEFRTLTTSSLKCLAR